MTVSTAKPRGISQTLRNQTSKRIYKRENYSKTHTKRKTQPYKKEWFANKNIFSKYDALQHFIIYFLLIEFI